MNKNYKSYNEMYEDYQRMVAEKNEKGETWFSSMLDKYGNVWRMSPNKEPWKHAISREWKGSGLDYTWYLSVIENLDTFFTKR